MELQSTIKRSLSEEELGENNKRQLRKKERVKYYESGEESEEEVEEKDADESSSDNDDKYDSDFDVEDHNKGKSSTKKMLNTKHISEYEKQLEEKKAKNLEFLKSLGIEEAKSDLADFTINRRKKYEKKEKKPIEGPVRVSERRKELINYKEEEFKQEQQVTQTFKQILNSDRLYEKFVDDFAEIANTDDIKQTPVPYDKDVFKQLEEVACTNRVCGASAMSWYPCSTNFVLAIGDIAGNLNLCNVKEFNLTVHKFSIQSKKIAALQFNPHDTSHLLSASLNGTILDCDIRKQICTEMASFHNRGCSYFDFLSASSYLVSLTNGEIVIIDRRVRQKDMKYTQKKHLCHESYINFVNVHPVNKNYFVTSARDKTICIWDLRKLSNTPVIESMYYRKAIYSATFSPLTGKFLLTAALDNSIRIFECETMTEESFKCRKVKKCTYPQEDYKNRPAWVPNSDEIFAFNFEKQSLHIYDKDFNIYETVNDEIQEVRKLMAFHPYKHALASCLATRIAISALDV